MIFNLKMKTLPSDPIQSDYSSPGRSVETDLEVFVKDSFLEKLNLVSL